MEIKVIHRRKSIHPRPKSKKTFEELEERYKIKLWRDGDPRVPSDFFPLKSNGEIRKRIKSKSYWTSSSTQTSITTTTTNEMNQQLFIINLPHIDGDSDAVKYSTPSYSICRRRAKLLPDLILIPATVYNHVNRKRFQHIQERFLNEYNIIVEQLPWSVNNINKYREYKPEENRLVYYIHESKIMCSKLSTGVVDWNQTLLKTIVVSRPVAVILQLEKLLNRTIEKHEHTSSGGKLSPHPLCFSR